MEIRKSPIRARRLTDAEVLRLFKKARDSRKAKTAAEIMSKPPAPVQFLVPSLPLVGHVALAGNPKSGKSWFALQLALAVAGPDGSTFMGEPVITGDVLYLALEDNDSRMYERIAFLGFTSETAPHRLTIAYDYPKGDQGLAKIESKNQNYYFATAQEG